MPLFVYVRGVDGPEPMLIFEEHLKVEIQAYDMKWVNKRLIFGFPITNDEANLALSELAELYPAPIVED